MYIPIWIIVALAHRVLLSRPPGEQKTTRRARARMTHSGRRADIFKALLLTAGVLEVGLFSACTHN
ncbi:MAG: hypothetical protein WB689_27215, partial [Xanthobacteraceae bacterium]